MVFASVPLLVRIANVELLFLDIRIFASRKVPGG